MTIDELIDRLERATGPDRELDADISIALGLTPEREWWSTDYLKSGMIPPYAASVDAAVSLAERICPGVEYEITNLYNHSRVTIHTSGEYGPSYGDHPSSMPLAILIAILRAHNAKESQP